MDMDIASFHGCCCMRLLACIHCVALLDSDGIAGFHGNSWLLVDSLFVLY